MIGCCFNSFRPNGYIDRMFHFEFDAVEQKDKGGDLSTVMLES
jgi:hypothetical protein